MATSERARHELYARLEEVIGPVHTDTLMDHLPPSGWGDVATRQDLRELEARLDTRIAQVETTVDNRITQLEATLDNRIAQLDAKIDNRTAQLDVKVDSQIAQLREEMRAMEERVMSRVHRALALQTATLLAVVLTAFLALGGS